MIKFIFLIFILFALLIIISNPIEDSVQHTEKPKHVYSEKPKPLPSTIDESSIVFGGYPKPYSYPNSITILDKKAFVVGYDEVRKCPVWVAYRVDPDDDYISPKRPSHFDVDYATNSRVDPDDYKNCGYDRGHLAPNYAIGSRYGKIAQLETFRMSNIAPQKKGLNRGYWKDLEELEAQRGGYYDKLKTIWVICGCIWDNNKSFVAEKIEIPDYFYKIIIDIKDGKPRVMGFVFPQVPPKKYLKSYLKSVDDIEDLVHIDFMADLDDALEDEIEGLELEELWE